MPSIVDKLVSKKKKKRVLHLDLNSGSHMFVEENKNDVPSFKKEENNIIHLDTSEKPKIKSRKKSASSANSLKEFQLFKIDDEQINKPKLIKKTEPEKPITITKIPNEQVKQPQQLINKLTEPVKQPQPPINKTREELKDITFTELHQQFKPPLITHEKPIIKKEFKEPAKILPQQSKKPQSRYNNKYIISASKRKHEKLLEKERKIEDLINYKSNQIKKMKSQEIELENIKKVEDEKRKLYELEKKLAKIEKIKYLHQKKMSLQKYKHQLDVLNTKKNTMQNNINFFNTSKNIKRENLKLPVKTKEVQPSNNLVVKKLNTPNYYIDVINKKIINNNNVYNKFIEKYKNPIQPNNNIFKNKIDLEVNLNFKNINKLISIIKNMAINEKQWHSIFNYTNFNFDLLIKN